MKAAFSLFLLLYFSLTLAAAEGNLVNIDKAEFLPGDNSTSVQKTDGEILLPLPFDQNTERFFWDVAITAPSRKSAAIAIEYHCDDPAAIRSVTLHLQDNGNWLTASAVPGDRKSGLLIFNRTTFQPESGAPEWQKARKLRISFWKNAERKTAFKLIAIREYSPTIGIIRGGTCTAPGETDLAAKCSTRAFRLFERAGLASVILDDDFDVLDFDKLSWIVLPYNPQLSRDQIDLLETFVKKHNGKLAVFYNADRKLAALLDIKLLQYSARTRPWTTVAAAPDSIKDLPEYMPHTTGHLLPVKGAGKSSVTTGYWLNADGFPDSDLPAGAQSRHGFWFSHIPPLATVSAAQWLLANLAASDPEYRHGLETFISEMKTRNRQAQALAKTFPKPSSNEVRAVWCDVISARQRDRVMGNLSSNGINTVFEHIASAGFIRDRSDGGLHAEAEGSRTVKSHLANITASARRMGIEFHAWVVLFNAGELPADVLSDLSTKNRLMVDADGKTMPWLCPSHPENRRMLLEMLKTLADGGVDGIHLDYVRYPERRGCYSEATRTAFEKQPGTTIAQWPADVMPGGALAQNYEEFRRKEITSFVEEAAAAIRKARPGVKISAAVYPTAESAASNGQDWPEWLKRDLLDFICPMLYTQSAAEFSANILKASAHTGSASRIVPGIGATADESQLDALSTAEQIVAARRNEMAGFAFFKLDSELTTRILPVLGL